MAVQAKQVGPPVPLRLKDSVVSLSDLTDKVIADVLTEEKWEEMTNADRERNKKHCGRHTGPVLHHRQVVFTRY